MANVKEDIDIVKTVGTRFGGLNLALETSPEIRIAEGINVELGGLAVRNPKFSIAHSIQYGDQKFELGKEYDGVKFTNMGQFCAFDGEPKIAKQAEYYNNALIFAWNKSGGHGEFKYDGPELNPNKQQDLRDFFNSTLDEMVEVGVTNRDYAQHAKETFENEYGKDPIFDNTFDRPYLPLNDAIGILENDQMEKSGNGISADTQDFGDVFGDDR